MKPESHMQLKDFIKLNKSYGAMNNGRELGEDFLVEVYKSIASEPRSSPATAWAPRRAVRRRPTTTSCATNSG